MTTNIINTKNLICPKCSADAMKTFADPLIDYKSKRTNPYRGICTHCNQAYKIKYISHFNYELTEIDNSTVNNILLKPLTMQIKELLTSRQFGLLLKSMTTKEFCQATGAEIPTVKEGAAGFFRIDAMQLRLRNDYDKFLAQEITEDMRHNMFATFLTESYLESQRIVTLEDAANKLGPIRLKNIILN